MEERGNWNTRGGILEWNRNERKGNGNEYWRLVKFSARERRGRKEVSEGEGREEDEGILMGEGGKKGGVDMGG